jgi:hypothetical protein
MAESRLYKIAHCKRMSMVQRKVSNGVAGLAAAGSSLDRNKIAAIPAISAMQLDDHWPRKNPGNLCDFPKG